MHHMSLRDEMTASKKANMEGEASCHLIKYSPCPTCHHPVRFRHGLKSQNNDLGLTVNGSHAWSLLNHRDLDLGIKDGHAWSQVTRLWPRFYSQRLLCLVPAKSSRPQVSHQRWPCLVSDDATTTSIWFLSIAMLGPHTIATTMNRLSVIVVLGPNSAIRLRP